jgi:hypothetical protein
MSRYRHSDILCELLELAADICGGIRLQLNYYTATVYKQDISETINKKVESLRTVANLSGEDKLLEPLRDYEAMKANAHLHYVPGECSYAVRVTTLLRNIETAIEEINNDMQYDHHYHRSNYEYSKKIQKNRRKLVSICRKGTRQHIFFSGF